MKNIKKSSEDKKIEYNLKLLAKSSIIVFIGIFFSKIFTYLYRIVIARHYGPEVYGLFSLGMMVLGWFIAFSSFGLAEGLLRYVSFYRGQKNFEKIKHIFKIATRFAIFSGIISAIILFLLADFIALRFFHNSNLAIFLKIFSITLPIALFSKIFPAVLRGFEKISLYSFIVYILHNAVNLLTLGIFIFLGLNQNNAVALSYSSGFLITMLASYFFCRYKLPQVFEKYSLNNKIKKQTTKNLFSYSWPLMFFGIIYNILYWTDSFVLGYFKGIEPVGFYNAATPIVALLSILPTLFMQLFFPLVTKEYSQKNFKLISQLSKQVSKWIFLLNLPLFLIIFLFPGTAITLLFGTNYLAAKNTLRLMVVFGFLISLTFTIAYHLLSMLGKSKTVLLNIIIATICNIVLNIMLVPRYGMIGAAISTGIVCTTLNVVLLLQVKYYANIVPLKKKIFRILVISLIPTFLLVCINQIFIINIVTSILLGLSFFLFYFLLIFITGCLDKNDITILTLFINKLKK